MASADIGPKGASLEKMREAGLPVPEAFYVHSEHYRKHLEAADLLPIIRMRINELEDRRPDAAETNVSEAALTEIRKAIIAAPVASEVEEMLRDGFQALGGGIVAVRSSATAEDLPAASFAGQHGTFFAAHEEELLANVRHCWASLWTDHAFAYRDRADIDHLSVDMAVIVQRLVPADAAGVAFTVDPITGEGRIIVEAVPGIGETLVSGKSTPDRWVLDRETLSVKEHAVAEQKTQISAIEGDRVAEVPVDAEHAANPVLTEKLARRVAELSVAAEDTFGHPLDVEWALEGDVIWLLQARPVTTLGATLPGQAFVWSSVNVGEVLPDVVSPMNWSILQGFVQEMLVGLFGHLGVTIADEEVVRLFAGRAYFNITVLGVAFRAVPGLKPIDLGELLGGMQNLVDIPRDLLDYDLETVHGGLWSTVRSLPGLVHYLTSHAPKHAGPFCDKARQRTEAGLALLETDPSEDDLVREMHALIDDLVFMADGLGFAGTAMSHWNTLLSITRRWLGDDTRCIATGLLAARGDVVSAEAGLAMYDLAAALRRSPELEALIRTDAPWEMVRGSVAAVDDGAAFLEQWDAFMQEHGHHSQGELEVANARWVERPDYVLDTVRGYLTAERIDLRQEFRARADGRLRLTAECRGHLRNPAKRWLFDRFLRLAQDGAGARELVKSEGVRRMAAIRLYLLAIGAKMVERGILDEPDDVIFLKLDELDDVRHLVEHFDVKQTVKRRRAERETNTAVTPPPVIIGDWNPKTGRTPTLSDARVLTGLGVSPGVVQGRARVISSVGQHEDVHTGEILVAPFTDPGWTPYFLPAAGIVMDMGGMLSHGSIIAREYGIPAVVNVGPATQVIETGDLVEVDGSAGVVTLLDLEETS